MASSLREPAEQDNRHPASSFATLHPKRKAPLLAKNGAPRRSTDNLDHFVSKGVRTLSISRLIYQGSC